MQSMSSRQTPIYDFDLPELGSWMNQRGEPAYRARQVFGWLYQRFVLSFDQMTDLPQALRELLCQESALPGSAVIAEQQGEETHKLLVQYPDSAQVECVSIEMDGAPTFCLSTQAGCAMGCAFCASTLEGCDRNLTTGEIVAQATLLGARHGRPGNLVFMGMGEPLLNLDKVIGALARFTDKQAFGLSPRRITVGTAGIVPQILRLGKLDLGVNLAVSLNSTRDQQRRELMPGVCRWTIAELLSACQGFSAATGGQPVTFAYLLIRKVNDFSADADRLAELLSPLRHHLNIMPLNPVEHALLERPSDPHLHRFVRRLRSQGLNVSVRYSKGNDIQAACGQLKHHHE